MDRQPAPSVRIARALLGCVVIGAPCIAGSVFPSIAGAEAALLLLALGLTLWRPAERSPLRLGPVGLVLGAAAVWTAAQLVPLPGWLLGVLSERAHAIRFDGPLLASHGWGPLTLDRAATAGALATQLGLFASFVVVRGLWSSSELRSARGPIRLVALAGIGVALCALGHTAVGAHRAFGLYQPITHQVSIVWLPVVNPNHLAALTNLGALASLGLALAEDRRELRWAFILGSVVCAITTLLTLSRGGIAALVLGGTFLFLRARSRGPGILRLALSLLVIVGSVAAYLALEPLREELATLFDLERSRAPARLVLLGEAARMAEAYAWTGAGRGSFAVGFPPFSSLSGQFTFTHAENLPLQLATEWGLPFGAVFLGVCATAWIWAARSSHAGPVRSASLAAVLAVAMQNLVDFSLEIASVGFATAICLSLGVSSHHSAELPGGGQRALLPAACLLAAVIAVLAGLVAWRDGHEAVGRRLQSMADARAAPADLAAHGRAAIRAHPADAYLPIQVARGLLRRQPRRALGFLNRALWVDPRSPAAHALAGGALLRLGHTSQAIIHYRLAARWDPRDARYMAHEIAARVADPDVALRLVPEGESGPVVLEALAEAYSERGAHSLAVRLAKEIVTRGRDRPRAMAFLARVHLSAGHLDEAITAARGARSAGLECDSVYTEALALERLLQHQDAMRVLQRFAGSCPEDLRIREKLALLAIQGHSWDVAERALAMYRGVGEPTAQVIAHGDYLHGLLEQARGRHAEAAASFQRAADEDPENAAYVVDALRAWDRIGRQDRVDAARRALDRLRE